MAFASLEFIYGDIPSSRYGLYLAELGSSSTSETDMGINYEMVADSTSLSSNYLFGMVNTKPLQFQMSMMSKEPIDRYEQSTISRTFFSSRKYRPLYILDDSMNGVYYMCKMNNVKEVKIGNLVYGYKVDVICDCPYAHETITKIEKTKDTSNMTIQIYNDGDDVGIVYPKIKLYPNKANGTISITNEISGTTCTITNLIAGETILLDSKYRLIKSDRMNLSFDRHNGNFIELLPNLNVLMITGDISKIEIEYELLRSVGA